MPRWRRTGNLSRFQDFLLQKICQGTPGMTRFGNKARTAVMLPVELAEKISLESLSSGKTVSEIIVKVLCEKYKIQNN